MTQAHPRAGGENERRRSRRRGRPGSSPRGRGKRIADLVEVIAERLIPARAGKTKVSGISSPTGTAHPRAGGENRHCPPPLIPYAGSSPRGRGKRPPHGAGSEPIRLIPARAWKTRSSRRPSPPLTAHPRAGGKNITAVWDGIVTVGSSPRGRGKHCEPVECSVIAGLIPARAGKTASMPLDSTVIGAHPRAGGENSRSSRTFVSWLGSSPRGRGKHQVWRCYEEHSRLIPARAGKTVTSWR